MGELQIMLETGSGVLPDRMLRQAIAEGIISAGDYAVPESLVQPASLDLRLGPVAYRLQSSFLPGDRRVLDQLKEYQLGGPIDLRDGAILETNRPYLVPLIESLQLPMGLRARANPKSSTGRVDVFTRLIVDGGHSFDDVPAGYTGPMYVEIMPQSFLVFVKEKLSLNQLRLIVGEVRLSDDDLRRLHQEIGILHTYGGRLPGESSPQASLPLTNGLFLSVNLGGDAGGLIGYKAKRNSMLLDLTAIGTHRIEDFWEPVYAGDGRTARLILEPEEFYLLVSQEGVTVPPGYAGDMTAYDPTSGELRTHYAGFFDPGFGYQPDVGITGSRAVLEVRAHDVAFALEDGQRVARLVYEKMAALPDKLYGPAIGSSYQNQGLTPSRLFVPRETRR